MSSDDEFALRGPFGRRRHKEKHGSPKEQKLKKIVKGPPKAIAGSPNRVRDIIGEFNKSVKQREGIVWKKDILECCDDQEHCCTGTFCPCCVAGHSAGALGLESFYHCLLFCFCPQLTSFLLRREGREKMHIAGSCNDDAIVSCFCPCCVNCQLANEIRYRKQKGHKFKELKGSMTFWN